jgi:hypothetical protein
MLLAVQSLVVSRAFEIWGILRDVTHEAEASRGAQAKRPTFMLLFQARGQCGVALTFWNFFWENEPGAGFGLLQADILRFWGLTGQRGWARLILDRLHGLALSPGDSKGSVFDPYTVAHEHHSFFFPDNGHGAADAAGFGWRFGV